MLSLGLTVGLSGCWHKTKLAPLPPVMEPVALVDIPEPENLPLVAVPQIKLPAVPYASNAQPKRERRRPPKVTAPATEQVASTTPPPTPEETAIGALTPGGEANPQTKQEAADLIATSEKRLDALSAPKSEDEKSQISKVKNFLKDAEDALKSGDAEGAKTLATKAKLLLDDLEK
jgi:ribosomal protein S20